MRRPLVLVLLVGACHKPQDIGGPRVLVFRETSRHCSILLSGDKGDQLFTVPSTDAVPAAAKCDGTAATDAVAMPITLCPGDPTQLRPDEVRAGIDRIDLVIDYGTNLDQTQTLAMPAPVLVIDGVAITTPAIIPRPGPPLGHGANTYYTASFLIPNVISSDVQISVPVVTGYGSGDLPVMSSIAPPVKFSLLRKVDGARQLVGASLDSTLGLTAGASTLDAGALLAGVDQADMVLDYGVLDVPTPSVVPAPSLLIDGVATSTTFPPATQQCSASGHTFFTETFAAPGIVTDRLGFALQVTPSLSVVDPMTYQLIRPVDSKTSPHGAQLSVLRLTSSGCEVLKGTASPSAELGLACTTGTSSTLAAGIDQLEVVVDLGKLDLPASAKVVTPTLTALVNGVPAQANLVMKGPLAADGHTYFTGFLTAPGVVSANLQFVATGDLGFTLSDSGSYALADPAIQVSLLVKMPGSCFTPLGDGPDPALGIAVCNPAPVPAPTSATAVVDELEVVIDYGTLGVPAVPAPTVAVVVDGVAGPALALHNQVKDGHTFFTSRFHAPATATGATIAVKTAADASPGLNEAIPLVAPHPVLTFDECPSATDCSLFGAVGSLHAHVTTQGDVSQTVTLTGTLDNGQPGPAIDAIVTSGVLGDNSGKIEIPVPPLADGVVWSIHAAIGATRSPAQQFTVRQPPIVATLTCPDPCTIAASTGDAPVFVSLAVSAPLAIQNQSVSVATAVNNIPDLPPTPFALTDIDNNHGTIATSIRLAVPTRRGTWIITAIVDGYPRAIIVTVV